ncbi:thioredoxin family protein [Blautia producta]|uniref:thioredoxin family protein n=1 Tax=Blautia producta TaxID=33035 RepID=UPI0031B649B9
MKKKLIGIISILILTIIIMCLIYSRQLYQGKPYDSIKGIRQISYEELLKKMDTNSFIVYVGRDDCQDCKKFNSYLSDYFEKNQDKGFYYLDLQECREKAVKDGANKEDIMAYEEIRKKLDIEWVPTVLFINKSKILSKYEFLSEEFYDIESKSVQEQELEKAYEDFNDWMNKYGK